MQNQQTFLGMYGKKSELETVSSKNTDSVVRRSAGIAEVTRTFDTDFARVKVRMVRTRTMNRALLRKMLNVKYSQIHMHLGPCLTDVDYTHALSALQRFGWSPSTSVVSRTAEQDRRFVQCSSNGKTCLSRMNPYIPVPVLSDYDNDTLLIIISRATKYEETMQIFDV